MRLLEELKFDGPGCDKIPDRRISVEELKNFRCLDELDFSDSKIKRRQ
jgi:hypothetical protein